MCATVCLSLTLFKSSHPLMHSRSCNEVWKTTWCFSPGKILSQSVTYSLRAQSCPCVSWKEPGSPVSLESLCNNDCHTMKSAAEWYWVHISCYKCTGLLNKTVDERLSSEDEYICMHVSVCMCIYEHGAGACLHTMLHKVLSITGCLRGNISNP